MSDMTCLHCGAATSNGLALCELCQWKATDNLGSLPIYFRNLARWRPGRAGSRPVPSSRVLWDGEVAKDRGADRVTIALNEAGNDLTTWAQALTEDRPMLAMPDGDDEPTVIAAICILFAKNITTVATLEWAGEFVKTTTKHEGALGRLTMDVVPGWYAGGCKRQVSMESTCDAPTYVVPGLTWVTCRVCGTTTFARDHLPAIVNEARDWVGRPMRLAEAIVALVDTELSVPRLYERIKKWEQREKIQGIRSLDGDGDPTGPKRYRMGDVLDMVLREGPTRVSDDTPTPAVAS